MSKSVVRLTNKELLGTLVVVFVVGVPVAKVTGSFELGVLVATAVAVFFDAIL
jgi:hypothetical protein